MRLAANRRRQAGLGWAGLGRVMRQVNAEVVKHSDACKFVVLAKPCIGERTVAWPTRCRRLAEDGSV